MADSTAVPVEPAAHRPADRVVAPVPPGANVPPAWIPTSGSTGGGTAGSRQRAQGEETLRRLLDAGREAFAQVGYSTARVDDVVAIAGTSHGTFYLYFRNKEDLLHRLAIECGADLDELTTALIGSPTDASVGSVEAWVAAFVDTYRRNSAVLRVWLERREPDPLMQALANDKLGALANALTARVDPTVVRRHRLRRSPHSASCRCSSA